jgi:uncharacterized coiled-coil protein SlyX
MRVIGCRYSASMNSDAVEQLQTKIAFLERANADLSDVVFRLHGELAALTVQVRSLADRLRSEQLQDRFNASDDERPPHY